MTSETGSMAGDGARILIVEDDRRLADLTREYLARQGFTVDVENNGAAAPEKILTWSPDLVILDIMLPGKDGLTICREVRTLYKGQLLMLTAREDDMDQIVGLELGADDYLVKPVQPRLLLARIRNLLRRKNNGLSQEPAEDLSFGILKICAGARIVTMKGQPVSLTDNEFDLLLLLAEKAGQVLSRDAILRQLRGIDYDGMDRSVDVRISRLRKKLDDDGPEPQRLKTVRSQGYLFVPHAWS